MLYGATQTERRPAYLRALERLFGARRTGLCGMLVSRAPVLFLMIEEAFVLYVVVCLLRAVVGRRTSGLLLRPLQLVVSNRWQCRIKRAILHWLKRFEAVQTLTILPFTVLPAAAFVARGWIYDIEFWDLTDAQHDAVDLLRRERRPGDQLVLTSLGRQSARKGFDLFTEAYGRCAGLRDRFRFIACGRVAPAFVGHAASFRAAGGVAVDRVISDAELLGAYAASDIVWCLYPPAGDHATGILGRAAQLGIPVLVREGSLAHRLCAVENIPHAGATAEGVARRLAGPLPPRDAMRGRRMAHDFARQSEARLREALGLVAKTVPAEA
ncbi:hypothetical protein GB928_022040 [Shinella curvata]|uniref:Glycosyltransferase involved in cell wall biosynthesis n=1 Tax=Shinella curvata TaxID=1817964 RepID=A0ABT8XJG3_9HYPH|nr:hypothetical protein [Shinella curvata]MCJ8052804.1 hypothetical protein [Shinella curvata]MDO6123884.1 hypothetical protein [Shinella curvata]